MAGELGARAVGAEAVAAAEAAMGACAAAAVLGGEEVWLRVGPKEEGMAEYLWRQAAQRRRMHTSWCRGLYPHKQQSVRSRSTQRRPVHSHRSAHPSRRHLAAARSQTNRVSGLFSEVRAM